MQVGNRSIPRKFCAAIVIIGGALLATLCLTTLAVVPYTLPLALVVLTLGGGFTIGVVAVLLLLVGNADGRRLAALALTDTYGQKGIATSGPVFRAMTVRGAEEKK